MNQQPPLVSVITPFYNTAAYLDECIRSVLAQTHSRFEYILLNNRSTDDSMRIARWHADRDERIRLIDADTFVPQVQNYNRAIAAASCDSCYIKLVEADNWIAPRCLEAMTEVGEAFPEVQLIGSYGRTETALRFSGLHYQVRAMAGREIIRTLLTTDHYYFGAPTTVMVRANAARRRRPFFPEDNTYAEDLRAYYEVLLSGGFGFVHEVLTFVRTENDSILSRIRQFESMALTRLILLSKYGRDVMDEAEFADHRKRTTRHYYDAVSKAALRKPGPEFWRYHRQGLETIDLGLEWMPLARGLVWHAVKAGIGYVGARLRGG